jgi:NTP pyrophosphatase (non-canonical NTP hydrolase)
MSESQSNESPDVSIRDFQQLIHRMYFDKDVARGIDGTFLWLMEEIGELATALRTKNDMVNLHEEFADVIAWLTTIANVAGVDLSKALQDKYGSGCPGCHRFDCTCPISEKP